MPPNYDYTEIENANENIEEIAFMPSTLETIDRARRIPASKARSKPIFQTQVE